MASLQEVDACTALALDPEFAEAYYWRAMARCESGYIIGAAADMRTCLQKLQGEDLKRVAQQVSLDKPDCALPGTPSWKCSVRRVAGCFKKAIL